MTKTAGPALGDVLALQDQMMALVRAFGLHQPDQTPCGQPIPVSEAYALAALAGEEPLTQQELGRRLRLEKSTISRKEAARRKQDKGPQSERKKKGYDSPMP